MPPRTRTTTDQPKTEPGEFNGAHASGHIDIVDAAGDERSTRCEAGSASGGFRLPLPNLGDLGAKRLLWYGGLGTLATIGILDWPVALVVGAGTVIAARAQRPDQSDPR